MAAREIVARRVQCPRVASLEHQALIELMRGRPESIAAILREFAGVVVPAGGRVAIADSQLGDVAPVQRSADLVAEVLGVDGRPLWAVVVEVQRAIDPRVSRLSPVRARERPVVAALSALIHNRSRDDLEVISCACRAMRSLDSDVGEVYAQLILQALAEPLRRELLGEDTLMERTHATQSTGAQPAERAERAEKPVTPEIAWVRRLWKRMDEEEARAIAQGRLIEKRGFLGKLLARAGVPLSAPLQARVDACDDPAALDRWIDRALAGAAGAALFD